MGAIFSRKRTQIDFHHARKGQDTADDMDTVKHTGQGQPKHVSGHGGHEVVSGSGGIDTVSDHGESEAVSGHGGSEAVSGHGGEEAVSAKGEQESTSSSPQDISAEEFVKDCWRIIEQRCGSCTMPQQKQVLYTCSMGWKPIRLFVSSTFADFHSEREHLVKKVFPALREWCEDRKLSLIECDLRWGVPRDSTTATTICTCLEELDRCFEQNDGEPFFMAMIGQRYGWIPTETELPQEVVDKYGWISDVSITCMEILHGAYRLKNPNAVFFLRDPAFLDSLPQKYYGRFVEAGTLAEEHLKMMKSKLRERFPNQTHNYTCKVLDQTPDSGKAPLGDLEQFGKMTLDFFKDAIERKYPNQRDINTLSAEEQETECQRVFIETKSEIFVGRDCELQTLLKFARGEDTSSGDTGEEEIPEDTEAEEWQRLQKEWNCQPGDQPFMCVCSASGLGKSALLARLTKCALQEGQNVFHHFVGSTSTSTLVKKLLERLLVALWNDPDEAISKDLSLKTVDQLHQVLKTVLQQRRHSGTRCLIVIDAFNELADRDVYQHLEWLPPLFPDNVRCVVSVNTSHKPSLHRIVARRAKRLHLQPLSPACSREIVTSFLAKYSKKLDQEQLELLTSHEAAAAPIWLVTACEELRIFGDFTTLTQKIKMLKHCMTGLLAQILDRILLEDETKCVEKLLYLLECSQGGLPEKEMLMLLGDQATGSPAPMITWATARRSVRPFIRTVGSFAQNKQRIQFYHSVMKEAVETRLGITEGPVKEWHKYLADHYEYHCQDQALVAKELPFHLQAAGLNKRLIQFFRSNPASIKVNRFQRAQYLCELRCPTMAWSVPTCEAIIICNLCSRKLRQLGPLSQQTGQSCFVCGEWIPHGGQQQALVCHRHKKLTAPGKDMCAQCNMIIAGPHAPGTHAQLCWMCTSGAHKVKCCKLLSEDNKF